MGKNAIFNQALQTFTCTLDPTAKWVDGRCVREPGTNWLVIKQQRILKKSLLTTAVVFRSQDSEVASSWTTNVLIDVSRIPNTFLCFASIGEAPSVIKLSFFECCNKAFVQLSYSCRPALYEWTRPLQRLEHTKGIVPKFASWFALSQRSQQAVFRAATIFDLMAYFGNAQQSSQIEVTSNLRGSPFLRTVALSQHYNVCEN